MVKWQIRISKEHLIAIGKIAAYFALLEFHLDSAIRTLIGGEQKMGNIITCNLSFAQKREV